MDFDFTFTVCLKGENGEGVDGVDVGRDEG